MKGSRPMRFIGEGRRSLLGTPETIILMGILLGIFVHAIVSGIL